MDVRDLKDLRDYFRRIFLKVFPCFWMMIPLAESPTF